MRKIESEDQACDFIQQQEAGEEGECQALNPYR